MIVCVPVSAGGTVGDGWGRARRLALATVHDGGIADWRELDVDWGSAHDAGTEGSHHARVVRFLREHDVALVVAHHMGAPMQHTLAKLGVRVALGAHGDARTAVLAAL